MTDPTHPAPKPQPSAPASFSPASPLMTREEVLAALREEVSRSTQAAVAAKYSISPTQLNDILRERGNLSKRALGKLRWELIRLYRKLSD